jgi:hypothetical protein
MKINYNNITTLDDLHNQVQLLKIDYTQKGVMLKQDAKTYVGQFSLGNLVKKYATPSAFVKFDEQTNISGKVLGFLLPLILNKTVFRGSGFITKALATLISGKVGQSLDGEHLSGIFNKVKSIFAKKKRKDGGFVDYGIPPDSETY